MHGEYDKTTTSFREVEAVLFDFGGVLAEEGFRAGLDLVHRTATFPDSCLPDRSRSGKGRFAGKWGISPMF